MVENETKLFAAALKKLKGFHFYIFFKSHCAIQQLSVLGLKCNLNVNIDFFFKRSQVGGTLVTWVQIPAVALGDRKTNNPSHAI